MRLLSTCQIGDRLWEDYSFGDPFSAGRIVAISESATRSTIVYLLLMSDDDEFTIYSTLKDAICKPHLCRFIPRENMTELFSVVEDGVELPDEVVEKKKPKKSKKSKKSKLTHPPESPTKAVKDSELPKGAYASYENNRTTPLEEGEEKVYLPEFDTFLECDNG